MPKFAPKFSSFRQSKPILFGLSVLNWPRKQIRALYNWVVGWAETKRAEQALATIAFLESSVFPIPPDPLLIATATVKPKKYIRLALITTLASIIGGILGYLIGIGLFESIGQWVIDTYELHSEFDAIGVRYNENALLTIFVAAFTPIPYKLITIAAGVFHVNFIIFIIASILGRGGRFFTISFLMHHLGKRYKDKIAQYVDILGLIFIALLILGFVSIKYVI